MDNFSENRKNIFERKYKISLTHVPDGKEHRLECFFPKRKSLKYEHISEAIETLTGEMFLFEQEKLFIGVTADTLDYEYLENGMAYIIHPETKNTEYEFVVWWTDGCIEEDIG